MRKIFAVFAIFVFIALVAAPTMIEAQGNYIVRVQYDASRNPIYVGYANPGTADGTAGWQIQKITYDANNDPVDVSYANGSNAFSFKWTLRITYTYS